MTQDNWQDCPTMKSVVEAMERGDEIETQIDPGNDKYCPFISWTGREWRSNYRYHCRPAKPKVKTVVMREAVFKAMRGGHVVHLCSQEFVDLNEHVGWLEQFSGWLDELPHRRENGKLIVEIPE